MCNSKTKRPHLVLTVLHILCTLTRLTQSSELAYSSGQALSDRRLREMGDAVTVVYTEGMASSGAFVLAQDMEGSC